MIPFKSIRIGPFDVSITMLKGMDRDNNLGQFSDTDMAISVRELYATRQHEAETLLHETLHAIVRIYDIKSKDTEERQVHQLSIALSKALQDNPAFFKWLMDSLK